MIPPIRQPGLPSNEQPAGPFATTFDVATQFPLCLLHILAGAYPVIVLAVAPEVAEQYLELLALCLRKPCVVLVEKPWASSVATARRLGELLKRSTLRVRYND